MLDLPINFRRLYCPASAVILLTSFLITPLHALDYLDGPGMVPKHLEQEWVSRYLNSVDEDTDVEEVVDFLINLRESLVHKGYQCPTLTEMADGIRRYLIEKQIPFDEEEIQEIYEEIAKRESQIHPASFRLHDGYSKGFKVELCKHKHKHKDKKDKKEFKMKSKGIFGFVKCIAGGLICIIPVPAVQAVGAGLVLNGINDIMDDARETGDENERLQKMDEQRRREAQQFGKP